jgi:ribosomal protein L37AE/L43A
MPSQARVIPGKPPGARDGRVVMPCPVCDGDAVKMSRARSWFCVACEVEFVRHEGQRK